MRIFCLRGVSGLGYEEETSISVIGEQEGSGEDEHIGAKTNWLDGDGATTSTRIITIMKTMKRVQKSKVNLPLNASGSGSLRSVSAALCLGGAMCRRPPPVLIFNLGVGWPGWDEVRTTKLAVLIDGTAVTADTIALDGAAEYRRPPPGRIFFGFGDFVSSLE
jgi:hypothetical protein